MFRPASTTYHKRTQDFGSGVGGGGGGRPKDTRNLRLNVAKNIGNFEGKMTIFFIQKQVYL